MSKWGFAFIAFGKDHIVEFNRASHWIKELLPDVPIWVGTDSPESIDKNNGIKVIHIQEEFNYNLKRIPIREGLKHCDIIWCCDTDVYFRDSKVWECITDIPIGIHPISILDEDRLGDINGKYDFMQEYLDALYKLIDIPPRLILEYGFIIRKGERTGEFLDEWERIDKMTRGVQHQQNGMNGASEGLIIWISASRIGIPIHEGSIRQVWNSIEHFGHRSQIGNQKSKRTIL